MLDRALDPTAPVNGPRPPGRPVAEPPAAKPPSTFKGVTQAGTLDGPELHEPLTPEAVRELKATLRPTPPPNWLDGFPHQPQPVVSAIVREACGGQAETPEEISAVRAEHTPWMNLSNAVVDLLAETPNQRRMRHNTDYARRTANGDTTASEMDQWTLNDWTEDQQGKLTALKRTMREHEIKAWQICKPIYQRLADAVDRHADSIEHAERKIYERYSMDHRPSYLVLAIRKVANDMRREDRSGVGSPLAMLPSITA